jgi:hypothetical protein
VAAEGVEHEFGDAAPLDARRGAVGREDIRHSSVP